jgi:subtilase family serine protease
VRLTREPTEPCERDTVIFTIIVENRGSRSADASKLALFVDGKQRKLESLPSISAGEVTGKGIIWVAEPGSHVVKAVVDCGNSISETDEQNNQQEVSFPATLLSDLTVQEMAWLPTNPSAGQIVNFQVKIKNQGQCHAWTPRIGYFVDETFHIFESAYNIGPGGIAYSSFSWVAEPGKHTIKVVADFDNTNSETNERNNEKSVTLTVPEPEP